MLFDQLPVELVDGICQHVSPHGLASLAVTCTAFYPIAQRRLYRQLSISTVSRNLSVVMTLARRPEIAIFVRSFSLRVASSSRMHYAFYCALSDAISRMSQLVSLDVCIPTSASWVLTAGLPFNSYPHLLRFTCSFHFDDHVAAFLAAAPALAELEVDSIPDLENSTIPSLPSSTIPHLMRFSGSARAARSIIPGRPVECVHLHSGDLTEEIVTCLAEAAASITVLDATTPYLPMVLLELLARHLPSLAYCRIATTHSFTSAPDVNFCQDIARRLAKFPAIREFELFGMHWGSHSKGVEQRQGFWPSAPLNSGPENEANVSVAPL